MYLASHLNGFLASQVEGVLRKASNELTHEFSATHEFFLTMPFLLPECLVKIEEMTRVGVGESPELNKTKLI